MCIRKIMVTGIMTLVGSVQLSRAQIGSAVNIIVAPTGIAQNTTTESAEQDGNSTILYTAGNSCDAIAKVESTLDLGIVSTTVTITAGPGIYNDHPFVGRYYEIHPSQHANSTATVTLYFSQDDFDAYNQSAGVLSGDFPPIAADGSNLLITAFHGLPSDGATGPNGEYDSTQKEVYSPTVVINSSGYFEASFTITGFSGFFAHTNNSGAPLLLQLSRLNAYNLGAVNEVKWATTSESAGDYFAIERGRNGSEFDPVGTLPAVGVVNQDYTFRDEKPFEGVNYYRLKLVQNDGGIRYSAIVSAMVLPSDEMIITAYPNPMDDILNIRIAGKVERDAALAIVDGVGRVYFQQSITEPGTLQIKTCNIAGGTYYIRYSSSSGITTIKISKK